MDCIYLTRTERKIVKFNNSFTLNILDKKSIRKLQWDYDDFYVRWFCARVSAEDVYLPSLYSPKHLSESQIFPTQQSTPQ